MKEFIKKTFIISLISFFLIELTGFTLGFFRIIPNGSPAVMSIFADSKLSYWHPKNITFKHDYNQCWGPSTISFNNIGSRSTIDVEMLKTKPRIGLLGDSMIEMIHVNDGEDITSILQEKLPDFEIINFSSRATGLYDHLDVYKNLIKNFDIDYLVLFPTENDLHNNFIESNKPNEVRNQPKFYFDELKNEVIKIDRNSLWFKKYFSNFNKIKRSKPILYLKEYSYSFKIYYQIKIFFYNKKRQSTLTKEQLNAKYDKKMSLLINQEKVYKDIMNQFLTEINKDKDNVKLITILNLRSYLFRKEENLTRAHEIKINKFNIIKDLWVNYNNAYFAVDEAKEFIKLNKHKMVKPFIFLGHTCDDHYSKFGAEFMANIVIKQINSQIK